MIRQAGQHVGEPSLRIDVVELGGGDEGVDRRRTPAAVIGAGEGPISSAHGNSPSIVPISGKMLKSFIAGMRFMDAVFD